MPEESRSENTKTLEAQVENLMQDDEFRPKWTNRRKVIFISLGISG